MNKLNIVSGFSEFPRYDFFVYAKGYKEAANSLLHDLCDKDHYGDHQGYPIIFLYRHALELYLKGIIYQGAKLASYENLEPLDRVLNDPMKNKTHNLIELSKKSIPILSEIFPKDGEITILCQEITQQCIRLNSLDKNSYSYRYPIDNSGNHSTKKQNVDLLELGTSLGNLFEKLDTLSFGMEMETDNLRDILDSLANEQ